MQEDVAQESGRGRLVFWIVVLTISVFTIVYAVTRAFVWDEGYHLIAAQQISQGKLPYLDFCFPQTPLNAFLNAGIIKLFGQFWQPVHVMATLFSLGSMLLTGLLIQERFPVQRWRVGCAVTAAVFVGLNATVVQFGTIGQAYGICLFFTVAAYRMALATPGSKNVLASLSCGLLASVAAGSSLLSAPVLPVLLIWIWLYDETRPRWRKAVAFLVGAGIPFLPMGWLFLRAPQETFFNIVQYHALYRRVDWTGATYHDFRVFTSWLDSTQALTLVLLALAGLGFLVRTSEWTRRQRGEFFLAAWIAIAISAYLCTPHPTFGRYFILVTPFVTIVAVVGLYVIGSKLGYSERPVWPTAVASVLMTLTFATEALASVDETTWQEYDKVASKIREVTPPGGKLLADEVVYFDLQQNPPSGMEVSYTHVLSLPPDQERRFHLVSILELKQQVARHEFATIQSCSDDEMERIGLPGPYRYRVEVDDDCTVFWGYKSK